MEEIKQFISVRNMAKYQHYKKDKPIWIKLYKSLWGEYEFSVLPDATKAHVIGLMILCSQHSNLAPFDKQWIAEELKAREPINWESVLNSGFIVIAENDSIKPLDKVYLQKRREEKRI